MRDDIPFARTLARKARRSTNPVKVAKACLADYHRVFAALRAIDVEVPIARSLAARYLKEKHHLT